MNDHFIPLRFNDDGDLTDALEKAYAIHHIPTLLIIRPDGAEIDRIIDLADYRNRFLGFLEIVCEGKETCAAIRQAYENDPDNLDLQVKLFKKQTQRGDLEGMMSIGKKILHSEPATALLKDAPIKTRSSLYEEIKDAIRTTLNRSSKSDMLAHFSDFPSIRFSESAYRFIASSYADSGQSEEATNFFRRALRDYPESVRLAELFQEYSVGLSGTNGDSHEKK